jgi:hypothetical protein
VLLKEDLHSKGPLYAFSNAGIELCPTKATTLNAAVMAQLQKKIDRSAH